MNIPHIKTLYPVSVAKYFGPRQ